MFIESICNDEEILEKNFKYLTNWMFLWDLHVSGTRWCTVQIMLEWTPKRYENLSSFSFGSWVFIVHRRSMILNKEFRNMQPSMKQSKTEICTTSNSSICKIPASAAAVGWLGLCRVTGHSHLDVNRISGYLGGKIVFFLMQARRFNALTER